MSPLRRLLRFGLVAAASAGVFVLWAALTIFLALLIFVALWVLSGWGWPESAGVP